MAREDRLIPGCCGERTGKRGRNQARSSARRSRNRGVARVRRPDHNSATATPKTRSERGKEHRGLVTWRASGNHRRGYRTPRIKCNGTARGGKQSRFRENGAGQPTRTRRPDPPERIGARGVSELSQFKRGHAKDSIHRERRGALRVHAGRLEHFLQRVPFGEGDRGCIHLGDIEEDWRVGDCRGEALK